MRITITNDNGEVFAVHSVNAAMAAWIQVSLFGSPIPSPEKTLVTSVDTDKAVEVVDDLRTALQETEKGKFDD